ncbi:MAG: TM0106 family RecB-like putative nuclease, partial [Synergistaceae bacterium]|nr:TM0106 family RecB-like putative nuclease [Synergistaceae bacterium]
MCIFAESPFASWMDRWYTEIAKGAPSTLMYAGEPYDSVAPDPQDAEMILLANKGVDHERAFLERLRDESKTVADLSGNRDVWVTVRAMESGADVIYQPYLESPPFFGYADFLIRRPGGGEPRYEVCDAKLARSIKPIFPLQLSLYSEMLAALQGEVPKHFHIALGSDETESFRTDAFLYLYRAVRRRFLEFQESFDPCSPPRPEDSAAYGRWAGTAERILERTDSLSLVANITRSQRKKLEQSGVFTMKELAESETETVRGVPAAIFERLREQAALQIASRARAQPEYRLIQDEPAASLLPPSDPGDVFFDIEGYPLADGGLEYLWGAVGLDISAPSESKSPTFFDWWAHDGKGEREAFRQFITWVVERRARHPQMRVYHYAPYETTAIKRLAAKYGTMEDEVDDLLREGVFVDLYRVVKRSLMVGTAAYSLKDVERLFREQRSGKVATGGASVVAYHDWIVSGEPADWQNSPLLKRIRDYNEEDCYSTWELVLWLRSHLKPCEAPAPEGVSSVEEKWAPNEKVLKRRERRQNLPDALMNMGGDEKGRAAAQLLGGLAGYHWREAKPVFWKKYDRLERSDAELADDPDCLGMLESAGEPRQEKKSLVYSYKFPPGQETKIEKGSRCFVNTNPPQSVTVHSLDTEKGLAELKLSAARDPLPALLSLIPDEYVSADIIEDSLHRTAQRWVDGASPGGALCDLLNASAPRLAGGRTFLYRPDEGMNGILNLARDLADSVLALQGPPGSGKTYTASRIIADLAASRKKIGVTANSHRAIINLMAAVVEAMDERGMSVRVVKAGAEDREPLVATG